jgi:hypothetical protein
MDERAAGHPSDLRSWSGRRRADDGRADDGIRTRDPNLGNGLNTRCLHWRVTLWYEGFERAVAAGHNLGHKVAHGGHP